MAIRAHGTQIILWVDLVFATNLGKLAEVVDFNRSIRDGPVDLSKVYATDGADGAVHRKAMCARFGMRLVGIGYDLAGGTLGVSGVRLKFAGRRMGEALGASGPALADFLPVSKRSTIFKFSPQEVPGHLAYFANA